MRFRNRAVALALTSLLLGAALGVAMPAVAQISGGQMSALTGTTPDHAAKVAVGVEIYSNLPVIRLLIAGAQKGIMQAQDPEMASMTPADRTRLGVLIGEEIQARAPQIIRKLAETNVDRFTVAQLNDILTLSKIKFFQDVMLAGADPSLASPANDVVTPAERDFMARANAMPYVAEFFDHIDMQAVMPDGMAAVDAAVHRFIAEKTGKPG